MKRIILHLDHGSIVVEDLKEVWVQPLTMRPGWMLCYEDSIYERGVIYRSSNKALLQKLGNKLLNAYATGKTEVAI